MGNSITRYGFGLIVCGTLALGAVAGRAAQEKAAPAEKISPQAAEFFETKVRPVLFENCFSCHNDKQQMGNLRLDSLAAMLKGNSAGAVITPGDPEKSLLIHVVRYDDKVKMPPKGKLKAEEIAALTEWVKMGAPWPGAKVNAEALKAAQSGKITEDLRNFWSFRPVKKPAVPTFQTINALATKAVKPKSKGQKVTTAPLLRWAKSPIDRFILTKLLEKGLTPAPSADKLSLLRRITFDLTGLPPTPQEVDAFLTDKSPTAYEKVVDRLLASPRYGERWGRHWLDVARYADTKGYSFTSDPNYYNAYTYRDYVIRAFNEDLPYDRFLIEQLAADRLDLGDDKRPLAALGFLTLGRRFLGDPVLIADDRIDTTMRGLQGLTVACARCHDHKFDPIPQKDYYSLYGVFASSQEPDPPLPISEKSIRDPYQAHIQKQVEAQKELTRLLFAQINRLRGMVMKDPNALPAEPKDILQKTRPQTLPSDAELAKLEVHYEMGMPEKLKALRETIAQLEKTKPPTPEFANALLDTPNPVNPVVFKRGNPGNPGEAVPRQFLAILSETKRKPFQNGSGRLELAQSIASPDNPLTARVMVNRVWQYHFGYGLVRTPGDFGTRGEPPTHPELMDWLAATFMEQNWSVKKLHRQIVLSNAYQMRVQDNPRAFALDPENRLLWRQNRQRLDLESLRDALLSVSGQLDLTMGGKAVDIINAPYTKRRTVYGYIERQNLPGLFRTFDFASPDISTPQRFATTVPQQALYMMNSPFVVDQARALAKREEIANAKNDAERIRALYRLMYGRIPTPDELTLGLSFVARPFEERTVVWQYGYGAFDEKTKQVVRFTPLPHFSGSGWQGGPNMPDPNLNWLLLTADGGHPGANAQQAVIRRWIAPADGVVSITGMLRHPEQRGDGVQARIVSSREGELGSWTAFRKRVETKVAQTAVRKGDTIDFVVDCRAEQSFDGFSWSPVIRSVAASGVKTVGAGANKEAVWSAAAGFGGADSGKGLSAWDRYVQTLLMTNEFCFVD